MPHSPDLSPDLSSPEEIAAMLEIFYGRVADNDLLGPVFVDQAQVDWGTHIPNIVAFWCKIELGIPGFNGAPTQKHAEHSSVRGFRAEQFGRWIALFHDTIDAGWAGPRAESIKARAVAIARMQSRMVPGAEPWDAE